MQAIKIENLTFAYEEGLYAVNDLSLQVNEGEYIAIVGRNGSGKSTVAKLINGLLTPKSGSVEVFGKSTLDKKALFEIRKQGGMVFQNPDNQMVATIVEDDVAFGPENIGLSREEIKNRIEFALKATQTEQFRNRPASELSGGQKQRVAIAGVLAISPKILILDEATSMLDPRGRSEVNEVIRALNKEKGITVITVTHYMEEAFEADRVIVMKGGKIAFEGSAEEVFSREKDLQDCGLCLPRATYIANRLKERGVIPCNARCFTDKELEVLLCESFAKA